MIYCILGKTSSGKTTITKELSDLGHQVAISFTTRPSRENEINGVDYFFIDNETFKCLNKKNKIVAPKTFFPADGDTWHYGFDIEEFKISKDTILVIDPQGLKDVVEYFGKDNVVSIYLNIDYETRFERCQKRGDKSKAEINRRFSADDKDFTDLEKSVDHVIKETNLYKAIDQIYMIIGPVCKSTQELFLTSSIPPSVNSYLNYRIVKRGKRMFAQPFLSKESKKYIKSFTPYVREQIYLQNWIEPKKGKVVYVEFDYYLDKKRKDPNNLLKLIFDVFSDVGVYVDDDIALPMSKNLFIDKNNPRIEIRVYEADSIGVFNSHELHYNFIKDNCNICKRRSRNCTILQSLNENRICKEVSIKDNHCKIRQ